ncbi:Pkr1-domain-containing protein [Patellaria atrata CBS 101060]|uniref:Pkr1-domain-containing protein n=1 Tax=Patellaria atrata CBS 101060 TaxID=1346257 RepID=A0A9P4S495_9PEZI|nr:Pkr1-domain-containing protein [Patellaria atrata CBS 101060]
MASLFESVWASIITPGPTPPLLLATNATFGALQLLLLALFLATRSVHFAALSMLCGGLWWAINWFARELAAAKKTEEEAERIRAARRGSARSVKAEEGGGEEREDREEEGMEDEDEEEGTETEGEEKLVKDVRAPSGTGAGGAAQTNTSPVTAESTGARASLAPVGEDEARRRRRSLGDSMYMSTDSEWEKVEGER